MTTAAALQDGCLKISDSFVDRGRTVEFGKRLLASSCAGIGQQIVDQYLHAPRTVDGKVDELVGVFVQLAVVTAFQQLAVAGHHA